MMSRRSPSEVVGERREPVSPEVLDRVRSIVEDVRDRGEPAVREWGERLGDLQAGAPLILGPDRFRDALRSIPPEHRELLERTASRIERFAGAQRGALAELRIPVPGGEAGHRIVAVEAAGCYVPGGRFPLPSTLLMTAVPARAAGVSRVVAASPRPSVETLAAAAVADVDVMLAVGGAQAIAALAYGIDGLEATDVVVGPGNAWVTAAKKLVSGIVGIDTLAGPSELVVLADETADAAWVAADLLAQAEHDTEALPVLVTVDESLADAVDRELIAQLETLPTAVTARAALARGFTVVAASPEEAIEVSDALAPEHLQVCARDAEAWAARCRHYGAVFVGERSAEVAGDYGAGPNHTLPTGGASRFSGGLSVYHFVRVRTWLALSDDAGASELYEDARDLARVEGLEAHARAAERRLRAPSRSSGLSDRPEESRTAGSSGRRRP